MILIQAIKKTLMKQEELNDRSSSRIARDELMDKVFGYENWYK